MEGTSKEQLGHYSCHLHKLIQLSSYTYSSQKFLFYVFSHQLSGRQIQPTVKGLGYRLIDVDLLEQFLKDECICKVCQKGSLDLWEEPVTGSSTGPLLSGFSVQTRTTNATLPSLYQEMLRGSTKFKTQEVNKVCQKDPWIYGWNQ